MDQLGRKEHFIKKCNNSFDPTTLLISQPQVGTLVCDTKKLNYKIQVTYLSI